MIKLQKDETLLVGGTKIENGIILRDEINDRIISLTKNILKKVTFTDGGWATLYIHTEDGRFWEKTYPQDAMHGGGPPTLTNLSEDLVKENYGDILH